MKKFILFWMSGMILSAHAQTTIPVSTEKTTSLIFPFPVSYVDRGSEQILVQPIRENPKVIFLKAASRLFPETTLSVVTEDGDVYAFTVHYADQPAQSVYHISPHKTGTLNRYCDMLLNSPSKRILKKEKGKMMVRVDGFFVKDEFLFIKLELHNHSVLDYDIELLEFGVTDSRRVRRTAIQEQELLPLHVAGNDRVIKACTGNIIVAALDKVTIPDAKHMTIRIREKNGGRHFDLKLRNRDILRAKILPELD